MTLEELTKSQMILLALLVSFVTSIATGIVTVALIDQAPEQLVQTVNRVVERTVETVIESPEGAAAVVTKEVTTVVVKEEDLITDSIEKNGKRVVRVYRNGDVPTFLGMGFIVSPDGDVVTDTSLVVRGEEYLLELNSGSQYRAEVTKEVGDMAVLSLFDGQTEETFPVVTIADANSLKLGQTAISLSGRERTNVSMGIVSSIIEGETSEEGIKSSDRLRTTIVTDPVLFGSPLINMFGEVIGMHVKSYSQFVAVSGDLLIPAPEPESEPEPEPEIEESI